MRRHPRRRRTMEARAHAPTATAVTTPGSGTLEIEKRIRMTLLKMVNDEPRFVAIPPPTSTRFRTFPFGVTVSFPVVKKVV